MSEEVMVLPDGRKPREVDFVAPDKPLTDVEAEAVARDLGLAVVSGLRLRRCRELGDHLNRLGAVKVARGQYLMAADRMEFVAKKMVEMIGLSDNLGEINEVVPNLVALERQIASNIKELVTAGAQAGMMSGPMTPQLPPPVLPVVVNNFTSTPPAHVERTVTD